MRAQRHLQDLSIEQLAEKSGLHDSYLGEIERGEANPSAIALAKIASGLGLSTTHVFTKEANDLYLPLPIKHLY
ncbi:helix-turn-helix domain-containing protein [Bacillus sp. SCS-153A]|uniref:helix-turn-helix domain-containing protein n=1 Tax=Rossellomorea sedimentorum TaxID=3115294 RepID=UPI003906B9F9